MKDDRALYSRNAVRQVIRRKTQWLLTAFMLIILAFALPMFLCLISLDRSFREFAEQTTSAREFEQEKIVRTVGPLVEKLKAAVSYFEGFKQGQESNTTQKYYIYPVWVER